jgi:hypothetical protein
MKTFQHLMRSSTLLAGALLCLNTAAFAQLTGEVTRVIVRPTTVKAEFTTRCGEQRNEALTEEDLDAFIDGAPVEFQGFRCPDPGTRAFSTVLLLDASEGVGQTRSQFMRDIARAFVDSLDGVLDEASVMMYNRTSEVIQQMTTIKPMLYSALQLNSGVNERHSIDALYHAVQEVSLMASHNTTAVVHFVTGRDEGGSASYTQLLSLALQRGVRLYIFALDAGSVPDLESLARLTGGLFTRTGSWGSIHATLAAVRDSLRRHAEDCSVVLPILCTDGGTHALDMHVTGCNDVAVLRSSYTAPERGVPNEDVWFTLGSATTRGLDTFRVAITLNTVPKTGVLYPAQFWLRVDPARLSFVSAEAPTEGLLHGIPLNVERGSDYIKISTDRPVPVSTKGLCLMLTLVARGTLQSVQSTIGIVSARSLSGCGRLHLTGGRVTIYPNNAISALDLQSSNVTAAGATLVFSALCDSQPLTSLDSAQVHV